MNKIMFRFVASGIPVWRGEQYNLAMFPLNIKGRSQRAVRQKSSVSW